MSDSQLFDDVTEFPDPSARRRYQALIGLEDTTEALNKEAHILLNPGSLKEWSVKHHKEELDVIALFKERHPFFIFEGDVGTGKTALAETFGDRIAREEDCSVKLYALSLKTRGVGAVGQMTSLITAAFDQVANEATKRRLSGSASVLLIDEADALAQSREESQMHHEDRAAVNALIRGLDRLVAAEARAIVVMCTNRLDALDPAVRRRAARVFHFLRPTDKQREHVLSGALGPAGFTDEDIRTLVAATGTGEGSAYGFTYSDLCKRFLPALVLDAYPDWPLTFSRARDLLIEIAPTPPFKGPQEK
jgi:SpoVK/Ycf46/Vps4 family AAA+-type ATPase